MVKKLIFILHFILVIDVIVYSQSVIQLPTFFREKIEIKIGDNDCRINGNYYFKNTTSNVQQHLLYYPFVINDFLQYPDSIIVSEEESTKIVPYQKSEKGISFSISIPAFTTKIYNVIYIQRTPNFYVEYMLTTTKMWGKPLIRANYVVEVPHNYKVKFISTKYDSFKINPGYVSYFIGRENFMPDKNLTIKWERVAP